MKFSILIANYNNGRFITNAIESVLNQTYSNWEIIIVDDASTDQSINIINSFLHDKRIILFVNDKNMGCGYTKRRCVENACGDICAFLDPDDFITPDAVQSLISEHIKYPDCSLIYSNHFECDADLCLIKEATRVKDIPANSDYLLSLDVSIHHFASFKRALYLKTSGISTKYLRAVDQDLYYKLEEAGNLRFLDKCLYYYRFHQGGISNGKNFKKAFYTHLSVMQETFKRRINSNYATYKKMNQLYYRVQYLKFLFLQMPKALIAYNIKPLLNHRKHNS